eukprot:CAMPEP_0206524106 /NCGR_PEP_ID=MMETSP0324_2-20121206/68004_1 /ASSEMBLY_ACC=CAM_ASM_000836 /TAXON_ID=2866 /ORGANISM="Crypthecodinium cohnii, Strain Seligo" /LENGTH=512 /DNA_ID=CAMNT_0054018645 /DNA_START=113 /DNA_END=1651 /DNA_ORIENTATION=+
MAPTRAILFVFALGIASPDVVAGQRFAALVQSSRDSSDRLTRKADVPFVPNFDTSGPIIEVVAPYQVNRHEIEGFGGAFTEAAALVYQSLPPEKRQHVMDLYFGPNGIGYSVGRIHMNSCDFSPKNYNFDDVDGDVDLVHFDTSVAHDQEAMIPLVKDAQATAASRNAPPIKLLASPWSPPPWMKTNGKMDGSNKPGLKDEYREAWAAYFSKWITAYKDQGVPIWAITPQNEAEFAAPWEACVYTPEQEMEFLGSYLGPKLAADHPEVKTYVFDHNKDHVYQWAQALKNNPNASKYATGIAMHWYIGDHFDHVWQVHEDFPDVRILATEATFERYRWHPGVTLVEGDWSFGEGYAHDIIGDLRSGSTGWIDWNLFLDQNGGPNHVNNVCDAAILVDTNTKEVYVHPQYYAMGHFSKYAIPGSRTITTMKWHTPTYSGKDRPYGTCSAEDGLEAVAVLRPDNQVAVIVLNCADNAIDFKLQDGDDALHANIPGHSIQTYLFDRNEAVKRQAFV